MKDLKEKVLLSLHEFDLLFLPSSCIRYIRANRPSIKNYIAGSCFELLRLIPYSVVVYDISKLH